MCVWCACVCVCGGGGGGEWVQRTLYFILPLKMLIGFYLVNLPGMLKCIIVYNGRCGRACFGLLLVTPLEQWGVEKWDSPGYFRLPEYYICQFST